MKRTIYSRSVLAAAGTLIFVFAGVADSLAQAAEVRINEIRKIVAGVNSVVEAADRSDEYSSIFVVELNVNRKENPYPAVGTYTSTAKFYYTYGNREKNPYPDRLIKIAVETRRSATVERTEVFFDDAREMVLYVKRDGAAVKNLYFSAGILIGFERDGKVVQPRDREIPEVLKAAVLDRIRLMKIFHAALN